MASSSRSHVALTSEQQGAITAAANAILGLRVVFTYKDSPTRDPQATGF